MKKSIVLTLVLLVAASVAGCTLKQKQPDMNQLAEDNNYHYQNKDLGFSLVLPPEFEYYQTQRVTTNNYIDLEIYVPISDREYEQLVPGYGRPILVRISENKYWQDFLKSSGDNSGFYEIAKKGDQVYAIMFWQDIPVDWQGKWSEDLTEKIKSNFSLVD